MNYRLIPLLFLAIACTGPQTPPAEAPMPVTDRVYAGVGQGNVGHSITATDETYAQSVAVPAARVLAVLPAVFQSLGLSVTAIDSASGFVRGEVLRMRRPFGGKTMVQLLDCGSTPAGPTAARFSINLTVTTRALAVTESSTDVATIVQAVAVPNTTSGGSVRCRPNRGISEIVAQQVRQAAIAR